MSYGSNREPHCGLELLDTCLSDLYNASKLWPDRILGRDGWCPTLRLLDFLLTQPFTDGAPGNRFFQIPEKTTVTAWMQSSS